jgi:hypothetical protein
VCKIHIECCNLCDCARHRQATALICKCRCQWNSIDLRECRVARRHIFEVEFAKVGLEVPCRLEFWDANDLIASTSFGIIVVTGNRGANSLIEPGGSPAEGVWAATMRRSSRPTTDTGEILG